MNYNSLGMNYGNDILACTILRYINDMTEILNNYTRNYCHILKQTELMKEKLN